MPEMSLPAALHMLRIASREGRSSRERKPKPESDDDMGLQGPIDQDELDRILHEEETECATQFRKYVAFGRGCPKVIKKLCPTDTPVIKATPVF